MTTALYKCFTYLLTRFCRQKPLSDIPLYGVFSLGLSDESSIISLVL